MDPKIRRQWHFPVLDLFADLVELSYFSFDVGRVPRADVQLSAPLVYVICQEPRKR